jgi:pyridoxal phosphate enzyme (YggS family)
VKEVLKELENNEVTVVAATKYFNSEEMRELFSEGITHFGENRVELLLEKSSNLEDLDITWHLIGTLQTKKVKKVINLVSYLHSLDNIKLAEEVNKRRTSPLKCFIQVNISNEETKHGLEINEVIPFLEAIASYENINIIGFMGMASYTSNEEEISNQFQKLNDLTKYVNDVTNLNISDLSIGMSNDYLIALKHDSTFLRLGSVLFKKEV